MITALLALQLLMFPTLPQPAHVAVVSSVNGVVVLQGAMGIITLQGDAKLGGVWVVCADSKRLITCWADW